MPEYRVKIDDKLVELIRARGMTINQAVTTALKYYFARPPAKAGATSKLVMRKAPIATSTQCIRCGRTITTGELSYFAVVEDEVVAICMNCYLEMNSGVLAEMRAKEKEARAILRELNKLLDQASSEYNYLSNAQRLDNAIRDIQNKIIALMNMLTDINLREPQLSQMLSEKLDEIDKILSDLRRIANYMQWYHEKQLSETKKTAWKLRNELARKPRW